MTGSAPSRQATPAPGASIVTTSAEKSTQLVSSVFVTRTTQAAGVGMVLVSTDTVTVVSPCL